MKVNGLFVSCVLGFWFSLSASFSHAEGVKFSIATGVPFFAIPEVSYFNAENQRWYTNLKVGFGSGVSLGWEKALDVKNIHAYGIVIGVIGVQDGIKDCEDNNDILCIDDSEIFPDETTIGAGITYSYSFNGLNKRGMRWRVEVGFGEGNESHEKNFKGGLSLGYQF